MDTDPEPAPGPLTSVDEALLRAARAWHGTPPPCFWERFPIGRRASLRWGWRDVGGRDSAAERQELAREHAAQARPDLGRVHVSWWLRALKAEPESVRRSVVAHLPESLAGALRDGLGLSPADLPPDRPPLPGALGCALALWTVRLVGDLAERPDDPPVVVALTRLEAPTLALLVQTTGLAKWALTPRPLSNSSPKVRERFDHFRTILADPDPRYVQVAVRDVAAIGPGQRLPAARAGLVGFARLLSAVEPYRLHWALQHVPYTTARTLITLMGPAGRRSPMLVRWESGVLRAAWERLQHEGRLADRWGAAT